MQYATAVQTARRVAFVVSIAWLMLAATAFADPPTPLLDSLFPPGATAGKPSEVLAAGRNLGRVDSLRSSHPALKFRKRAGNRFEIQAAPDAPSGIYDVQAVGANGVSTTRAFFVSRRPQRPEREPNDDPSTATSVALESAAAGRIGKGGDVDCFRFFARKRKPVVVEVWADRIDSRLRGVLEVHSADGRRLAVSRGFFGVDPALCFEPPADGDYVIRLYDLIYSGSDNHFYRLDVGTAPRVVAAHPLALEPGRTTEVTLYGWNLDRLTEATPAAPVDRKAVAAVGPPVSARTRDMIQTRRVRIAAPVKPEPGPGLTRSPASAVIDGFFWRAAGAESPVHFALATAPVRLDEPTNHTPASAAAIDVPAEICGSLAVGGERDWYAFSARKGETIYIEGFGERCDAPVDLDLRVLSADGEREVAVLPAERRNLGGLRFPTRHSDPAGPFVAPADGRYLLMVRDLIGGLAHDARRLYRVRIGRVEPEATVVALGPADAAPAALNLLRGGRQRIDLLALRRPGLATGAIRVEAVNLPTGVRCDPVWIGPGVTRTPLVLTAEENAEPFVGPLELQGRFRLSGTWRPARIRSGSMIVAGTPTGRGRLIEALPLSVSRKAPLKVSAVCRRKVFQQGSIVDLEVDVQRQDPSHKAEVRLTAVGLPEAVRPQLTRVPPGKDQGVISLYLPPTLKPGTYSLAVQAETTAPWPVGSNKQKKAFAAISNTVRIEVRPAPFVLEVALDAPRQIPRGGIVKLQYTARRRNGFIGKIHTELGAPGAVRGLRVRGVTFVGQTESGTLQIIANENAPLGQQQYLRLEAVGTVEDDPVYWGACFVRLEIVERR